MQSTTCLSSPTCRDVEILLHAVILAEIMGNSMLEIDKKETVGFGLEQDTVPPL